MVILSSIKPKTKTKQPKPYASKSKRGECKNAECKNQRRHGGSAFCQPCSDKH